MFWLVRQIARRAPGRLLLGCGCSPPGATLAATALFIAESTSAMTAVALESVQVEYRALATTLNVDSSRVATQLRDVNGVRAVDVFGAANVVLTAPGAGNRVSARLIAGPLLFVVLIATMAVLSFRGVLRAGPRRLRGSPEIAK